MSTWQGGRVDLNVANHMDVPISLERYTSFEKAGKPDQLGVVYPGDGVRYMSHERERWVVRKGTGAHAQQGAVVLEWQVDIADGLVQDFVVE